MFLRVTVHLTYWASIRFVTIHGLSPKRWPYSYDWLKARNKHSGEIELGWTAGSRRKSWPIVFEPFESPIWTTSGVDNEIPSAPSNPEGNSGKLNIWPILAVEFEHVSIWVTDLSNFRCRYITKIHLHHVTRKKILEKRIFGRKSRSNLSNVESHLTEFVTVCVKSEFNWRGFERTISVQHVQLHHQEVPVGIELALLLGFTLMRNQRNPADTEKKLRIFDNSCAIRKIWTFDSVPKKPWEDFHALNLKWELKLPKRKIIESNICNLASNVGLKINLYITAM